MSFNATLTINCWKEHKCVGCGGTYRYKFTRQATGTGNTESDARDAVEKVALKKVEREVDERPCPHCGCIQPDMIGQKKANAHLGLMCAGVVAALVLLIMAAIPSATWMPYSRAASILGVISTLVLLAHWFIALGNPNSNRDKNRAKAEKLIEAGEMEAVRKPREDRAEGDPKALAAGAMMWLLLSTTGTVLIAIPVLLKAVSGWVSNDGLKPEVVGPGDRVRVYFDTRIDAVQSRWSGIPTATATLADGRRVSLPATSKSDSWGGQMSVKSSEKNTHPTLWADLTLGADIPPGAALKIDVTMDVRYPTMGGGNNFVDGSTRATLKRDLALSSAGAGHTYWLTLWAMIGGAVLLAVGGLMLSLSAGAMRQQAPDTRVFAIRDTDEKSADYRRRAEADDEEAPPRRRPVRDDDEGDWKK